MTPRDRTPRKKFAGTNHIMFGSGTALKYGGVKHQIVEKIIIIVHSTIRASTQPNLMAVPEPKHNVIESTKLFSRCIFDFD